MPLYEWKKYTPAKSKKIKTTVALECPHCGTIVKLSSEAIADYMKAGARVIQFLCPEPDCDSNDKFAEEMDRPLLDLRDVDIPWEEDYKKPKP